VKVKSNARIGPTRDERRQSLLDAARVLFAEKGYHDTTVDDITRTANVAKGTFYLYFSEKREIYYEVIRVFLEMVKEAGVAIYSPPGSPTEYVDHTRTNARNLIRVLTDNRQLTRMAYGEAAGLDPRLTDLWRKFYREIAEVEARNLEFGIQLGVVRRCHAFLQAYVHIGMVERVMLELLEHPEDFPPIDELVDEMLRAGYEGLRGPNGPPWEVLFPAETEAVSDEAGGDDTEAASDDADSGEEPESIGKEAEAVREG
jgi:AcrR family transcriptional regulator